MSRTRSRIIPVLAALLLAVAASSASAGEPRTHDGFLLRLSAGLGGAGTSQDIPGSKVELSGVTGDVNFAIGGAVSKNFILHGTIWGWSVTDPDVEVEGLGSGELDGDLSLSAVGAGFTWYIMPANMYISPSIGVATMTLDIDGFGDAESDPGFGLDLTVGKEWWVGDSWGLGIAGNFGFHSIPDEDFDENLTGANFGVRFSATLN